MLGAIETAIRETEARHAGEIRFAVETALDMAELVEDLRPAAAPCRCSGSSEFGIPHRTMAC